jgi:hypothetical protein
MKSARLVAFGTWMVDHFTFGLTNQALSGDLLEEMQSGRPVAWYWRQVCSAVATGLLRRLSDLTLPLIYCAAWTLLYPVWNLLSKVVLVRVAPLGLTEFAWPKSELVPICYGIVPALAFVWLGFLVYVLLRIRTFHEITAQRVLWGASGSLNVLLASTQLLLWHFRRSHIDLDSLMRPDFYSGFHFLSISIPLALSLLGALVFATSPVNRHRGHGRQHGLQSV